MTEDRIAICVPTFRRPEMLEKCLAAIAALAPVDAYQVELIVVDNDAAGSARALVENFAATAVAPVHYYIETERGLVCARNRLLDEALRLGGAWLAFIDDDEWPEPVWLDTHMRALRDYGADVATGPVIPVTAEGGAPPDMGGGKSRRVTGEKPHHVACNNVVFSRRLVATQNLRFDPRYNFIGGEDFDFFDASAALGNTHVWVAEARVFETLPADRLSARYLFKRHFSGGITSVIMYRKRHGAAATWGYFVLRALGKLLSALVILPACLLPSSRYRHQALKRFANVLGYLSGLFYIRIERYR